MKTELYWTQAATPGRLAIMPRPRGQDWLEDEIRAWRGAGIDIVVSLLTASEVLELELSEEEIHCKMHSIEFRSFPIPDRGTPDSKETFLRFVKSLASELAAGKNIAIHCRQGIGRAPLMALGILVMTGLDCDSAVNIVAEARGCSVPETAEQQRWLADFAKGVPAAVRG